MSRFVAVVTDSTAYLPADLTHKYAVGIVPLQVVLGGRVGEEGLDVQPADVADALRRRTLNISTSRPCPDAFVRAYLAAAERGASAVVSVHLSGELSGTVDAARVASAEAPLPVRVVDSRSTAMGLGFAVLAAADAAAAGAAVEQVAQAADDTAARTAVLFYVDTLEFLRRGGRIGAAAAMLGSALAVKPLLQVADGRIVPLEKVRTTGRALARLEDRVAELAADGPVDLAVHHLAAADRAQTVAGRLQERLPAVASMYVCEVGAVIGAHVGPGLLGVVVSPHRDRGRA